MNIADFITELYCQIDDALPDVPQHSQAILSLSELVTIGVLQARVRGVFTRYDKLDAIFSGFILFALIYDALQ